MAATVDWKPSTDTYDRRVFRHIDELIGCACFPDLLCRRLFPNGKEITESAAVYHYVRWHLPRFALRDPSVAVVSVGDGHTPRTAALFAFRSAWQCHSVDPCLRDKAWDVQRLHCHRKRIEDCSFDFERVVIVGVHSHASIAETLAHVRGRDRALVWMPCCRRPDAPRPPDVDKVDPGVWSPQNRLLVWERI